MDVRPNVLEDMVQEPCLRSYLKWPRPYDFGSWVAVLTLHSLPQSQPLKAKLTHPEFSPRSRRTSPLLPHLQEKSEQPETGRYTVGPYTSTRWVVQGAGCLFQGSRFGSPKLMKLQVPCAWVSSGRICRKTVDCHAGRPPRLVWA